MRSSDIVHGLAAEFTELWRGTLSALTDPGCPPPDWSPAPATADAVPTMAVRDGPKLNSTSVIVRHLSGANRFWVGELVGGIPSGRDRSLEFAGAGLSRDELLEEVARAREVVNTTLARLRDEELTGVAHPLLKAGRPVSRLYCILHALTHHAHHNGQLVLLRRLWSEGDVSGR